ncbi:MAG: hypothetical protein F9K18_01395 [Thermoanaerobaculia bacterium]|nr:MAG: hypothetical protein F9K18_01395 [Thermoanaerobaculia bacterium]
MSDDDRHLQLLSIFHYVVAGLLGLFSLFPLLHLSMGVAMISGQFGAGTGAPMDHMLGWFFVLLAGGFMLAGLALATCVLLAGHFLEQRRRYDFCLVAAGAACVFSPFGTVLGVFTIIVLMRDSVRAQFGRPPFAATGAAAGEAES